MPPPLSDQAVSLLYVLSSLRLSVVPPTARTNGRSGRIEDAGRRGRLPAVIGGKAPGIAGSRHERDALMALRGDESAVK